MQHDTLRTVRPYAGQKISRKSFNGHRSMFTVHFLGPMNAEQSVEPGIVGLLVLSF
jgi:hypothetical protein